MGIKAEERNGKLLLGGSCSLFLSWHKQFFFSFCGHANIRNTHTHSQRSLMALIGDQFGLGDELCGIVVSEYRMKRSE